MRTADSPRDQYYIDNDIADLERRIAKAIWWVENMKGGSDDYIKHARAAMVVMRLHLYELLRPRDD